jgi:hypothetical protein
MCKGNTGFIVQSFDRAAVGLAFGLEIVERNFLVRTQHAGDFLQRFEARAHGAGAPWFQTGCGPGRATVEPKAPGEPSIARRSGMG